MQLIQLILVFKAGNGSSRQATGAIYSNDTRQPVFVCYVWQHRREQIQTSAQLSGSLT